MPTMISKATYSVLALALLAACSSAPLPARPEPNRFAFQSVADSLMHFALRETLWGVEVWDQARNEPIFAHNSGRHFVPASNTKLIVTTVALGLLGPDWRYRTPVMLAGAQSDSAPSALIIKGSGDPTMSARYFSSRTAVLDAFADSLSARGVRRIAGDVLIDATAFTPGNLHGSWEIGDLPWYYATRTAAFAVAEAETRMVVTMGSDGAAAVRLVDTTPFMPVRTQIRMDTAGARANVNIDFDAWPDTLVVVGSMAPNSADTSRIALPDPEAFAVRELIAALERKSIPVAGRVRVLRDSAEVAALPPARPAFAWESPPLIDVVAGILRPSQNWMAEQLLKTLGYTRGTAGTWREGLTVERRYLIDVVRIDSLAFSLSDGSGLSSQNLMSPHAFVMLLEHARRAAWGAQYRAALPAPGLQGATLSARLKGLETQVAAKTGTIANVNSLSGYLRTDQGRDLTFSIITNGTGRPSALVRAAMDTLVRAIAREKNWE